MAALKIFRRAGLASVDRALRRLRRLCLAFACLLPAPGWSWVAAADASDVAALRGSHVVETMVTGVADGDTCYVVINGKSTRVRLAEIDAPEKEQAFGRRSEQSLRELVGGHQVMISWSVLDRWGRPVVHLAVDGRDVSAEQVRRGFAWVYRAYSRDATLLALEADARRERRGLWADAHPIEPWLWRRSKSADWSADQR